MPTRHTYLKILYTHFQLLDTPTTHPPSDTWPVHVDCRVQSLPSPPTGTLISTSSSQATASSVPAAPGSRGVASRREGGVSVWSRVWSDAGGVEGFGRGGNHVLLGTHKHTCIYSHTNIHVSTHTQTYTSTHTQTYMYLLTHKHTCIYSHTNIHVSTHTQTYTLLTHKHTCIYSHTNIHVSTHTQTYMYLLTHKHTHLLTHKHTCIYSHTNIHASSHTQTYTSSHTQTYTSSHTQT